MRKRPPTPDCPDPDRYTLVRTRRRSYWRKRRGTVTPAKLNEAFAKNVKLSKLAGPVSKRIMTALSPYTTYLETGWLNLYITNAMKKGYKRTGEFNLSVLENLEIQEEYPLEKIVENNYKINVETNSINVRIPIWVSTMKRPTREADRFSFELMLLWGDPSKDNKLRTEQATSEFYSFQEIQEEFKRRTLEKDYNGKATRYCDLQLVLPGQNIQWIVLIKVSCQFEMTLSGHPKYYGMKVIATSAGQDHR